jgi:VanZ family protein
MTRPTARRLTKLLLLAYWALLTVVLTAPHPEKAVGLEDIPWFPFGDTGIHFCAFCALAFLACLPRWPAPIGRYWALLLLGYAATTETLQAFIPCRSCELKDYFDNFLGIAAGLGIYWFVVRVSQRWNEDEDHTETTPLYESEPGAATSTLRVPAVSVRPRKELCAKK